MSYFDALKGDLLTMSLISGAIFCITAGVHGIGEDEFIEGKRLAGLKNLIDKLSQEFMFSRTRKTFLRVIVDVAYIFIITTILEIIGKSVGKDAVNGVSMILISRVVVDGGFVSFYIFRIGRWLFGLITRPSD